MHTRLFPQDGSLTLLAVATAATLFGYRDTSGLPSPTSDRRRQSSIRSRRPTASRQSESGHFRIHDDVEASQNSMGESPAPTSRVYRRASLTDNLVARQIQVFRGTLSSKLVASRVAIQSLERLETCSLKENEKSESCGIADAGQPPPPGVLKCAQKSK